MSFRISFMVAVATLALAACEPTTNGAVTAPPADGPVEPGGEQVEGLVAMSIFSDICLATSPSFRNAPAELTNPPFRQHPDTGTYYHQTLDLSIKLMPKRCSMVFASRETPGSLGLVAGMSPAMADLSSGDVFLDPDSGASRSVATNGTTIEFKPIGRKLGRKWYQIAAIAP